MASPDRPSRILSLDQFRGYAVLAMFVVNYWGHMAVGPDFLKHHNTYFSLADSVMPSFLFAVGMSFRLTVLRERKHSPEGRWWGRYFRRSMALVCTSVILYGFGTRFLSWDEINTESLAEFLAKFLKADLWEVLAIIGVTQILILPWISRSVRTRLIAIAIWLAVHATISQLFNFAFVQGVPNTLDNWLGTNGVRAWDGGVFGVINWCVPMLFGSIAYDCVRAVEAGQSSRRLLIVGLALVILGYASSCLSTFYELVPSSIIRPVAESPVIPRFQRPADVEFVLSAPPFLPPSPHRTWNYWMMSKRVVTASFVVFGSGFCFVLYAGFVAACDQRGWQWAPFETFGKNPLLAYVIHHLVLVSLTPLFPSDSPWFYAIIGFVIFIGITYLSVRHFEKQKIFVRL